MRVCNIATIRAVEQKAFEKQPSFEVMEAAATQVARACSDLPDPLLFVAGKGNNGGDAHVAAAMLNMAKRKVMTWRPLGLPSAGGDAEKAAQKYAGMFGENVDESAIATCGAVVDGLFGIGIDRDLKGKASSCVESINASGKPVLAIDVPSGLCSDSGAVMGAAVKAVRTVTFFAHKPGLLMRSGKTHAGEVIVADLGYAQDVGKLGGELIDHPVGTMALRRSSDSHKGSHGSLAVIGGSDGMLGALYLAARSAVSHGAGKVFAVETGSSQTKVDIVCPEIMWRENLPEGITAAAVGIGAGISDKAKKWLNIALDLDVPLLIDADGLNMVSKSKRLLERLKKRKAETLLTPHPAEAARLAGTSVKKIQGDRVAAALMLAKKTDCVVALKGAGTVVAGKDKRWGIVNSGNAGLAQAGSGDVLTGITAALLCQGIPAWESAAAGSWLMGAGADIIDEMTGGGIGLRLNDIASESSALLSAWLAK